MGCTRESRESSSVVIQAPEQGAMGIPVVGADKKFCFGVNVVAGDLITSPASSCSPALGITSRFVDPGQDIVLEVPGGTARQIDLYAYLTDAGAVCPAWDSSLNSTGAHCGRMYKVGSVANIAVSGAEITVSMPIENLTLNKPVLSELGLNACDSPQGARVISQLSSTGQVLDVAGALRASTPSAPIWEALSQWLPLSIASPGVSGVSSGGLLMGDTVAAQVPPYVRSLTRKPDSLDYYGLIGEGTIVRLVPSTGALIELDASTCPFASASCQVHAWVQSISPGHGNRLYLLDHGGQIYRQQADASLLEVATVPEYIGHVVYC